MGRTTDDSAAGGSGNEQPAFDVRDRVILALVAVILGGGGAAGYMNLNPPRPDPWTGSMDRERMVEEQREDAERIAEIYRSMNARLEKHDDHIAEAVEWKRRIREVENRCQRNDARTARAEERIDDALESIKGLDQRLDAIEKVDAVNGHWRPDGRK